MTNIDQIYADCISYKFEPRTIRVVLASNGYTEQEIEEYLAKKGEENK